jgi:hypothetical protein
MPARSLPRLAGLTWRAALPAAAAAAAALTLVAGLVPAQAASASARSISDVFGAPDYPLLQGLSVSGPANGSNTWFFPEVSGPAKIKTLGLVWNGSAWQTVTVPATDSLLGLNVLGRHNVWQWGTKPAPPDTLGFGPPWLRHYNGKTWRTVPVPGVAAGASVVSATDMWAVGPTTATAGKTGPKQVYIAMHWTGRSGPPSGCPSSLE